MIWRVKWQHFAERYSSTKTMHGGIRAQSPHGNAMHCVPNGLLSLIMFQIQPFLTILYSQASRNRLTGINLAPRMKPCFKETYFLITMTKNNIRMDWKRWTDIGGSVLNYRNTIMRNITLFFVDKFYFYANSRGTMGQPIFALETNAAFMSVIL